MATVQAFKLKDGHTLTLTTVPRPGSISIGTWRVIERGDHGQAISVHDFNTEKKARLYMSRRSRRAAAKS